MCLQTTICLLGVHDTNKHGWITRGCVHAVNTGTTLVVSLLAVGVGVGVGVFLARSSISRILVKFSLHKSVSV